MEATTEASLNISVSRATLDVILRLKEAGLIDFDHLSNLPGIEPHLANWTYEEFNAFWSAQPHRRVKSLNGRDSTVLNRARYLRFLESHPVVPVRLHPPDEQAFLEHIAVRKEMGDVTGAALNHYRKSLNDLLDWLGVPQWRILKHAFPEIPHNRPLIPVEQVPLLWTQTRHDDPWMQSLVQHALHFGVYAGPRPPSEISELDLGDIDWERGLVTLTEVKKGGKRRQVDHVPRFALDGKNAKSLANWIDHHRPKHATERSEAVFVGREGERVNLGALATAMGEMGRQVWPAWRAYDVRRLFATNYLIDNGFDIYRTARALGDTVKTVERHYLDDARVRSALAGTHRVRRLTRPGDVSKMLG